MTQTTNLTGPDEAFGREVERFLSRARLNRVFSHLLAGVFFSLCAAAFYALVNDFILLPIQPPLFAAIAVACGAAAAAALAAISRLDARPLLIRADKALANGELSSTAYGLARDAEASIFRSAIVEDAARSLSAGDPVRILGRTRMRLLPFLPLVLACAALLSFIPIDFKALLVPKPALDPEIVDLGLGLESFGRKLEKKAAEEDLKRSLALAEELQQLGQDFQNQRLDQSEAAERLAEMESRIAEEYGMRIQRFDDPAAEGSGGGSGSGEKRESAQDSGQAGENEGQGDAKADQETGDLGDTLDMLSERRRGLGSNKLGENSEAEGADPSNKGHGGGGDDSLGDAADGLGEADDESTVPSKTPGTVAAEEKHGEATDIDRSGSGGGLKADAELGEGDFRNFLLRALPDRNSAKTPESNLLGQYERTAESALAGEEIPLGLREYIKGYFISLGMLGTEN